MRADMLRELVHLAVDLGDGGDGRADDVSGAVGGKLLLIIIGRSTLTG